MIKRKHTPGPWKSVWFPFPEECPDIFAHIEDAKGKWVAQLWSRVDKDLIESPEETKANARLIAAAPDMLEALESVELSYQIYDAGTMADMDDFRDWDVVFEEAREKMKEALKKARGEE